jgi:hypothetical protein
MATFSVTDRQTFRRCRRKWDYSSNARRNLTGIGAGPEELELGGLVHRALADWIHQYTNDSEEAMQENMLASLFIKNASDRKREIEESYENRTGLKLAEGQLHSLLNVVQLGIDIMSNYQAYHKSPIPEHMSFASPEQEVVVPVPGTEHVCTRCAGKGIKQKTDVGPGVGCSNCSGLGKLYHYLSATLDGLLQDKHGRLFVLEHKTYSNRPRIQDLHMNDQFTGYCWVVQQLGIGTVAGVAYDGMWKRNEPPKYMQKEKRPGRMEDLFIRKVLPKGEAELNEWGRNLAKEINEMGSTPEIYPNVPWQGCSDCNFQEVCMMQMKGEDPARLLAQYFIPREPIVRGGK